MANTDLKKSQQTSESAKLIEPQSPECNNKNVIHEKALNQMSKNTFLQTEKLTATASAKQAKEKQLKEQVFKPVIIKKTLQSATSKTSDTNLVLLIILCFLWWLNLLAVYIHDDNSITLNFWITLLLDFTLIGGIIFSLLVVLDVVDLK